MKETIHITFHHGSPGHPADFDELIRLLPSNWMFSRRCRYNPQEQVDKSIAPTRSCVMRVAVGWSFGAVLALESLDRHEVDLALLICPWLRTTTRPSFLSRFLWLVGFVRTMSPSLLKKHVRRTLAGRPDLWAGAQNRWSGLSLAHALQEKTRESPKSMWMLWKLNNRNISTVVAREDHLQQRLTLAERQFLDERQPEIISGPHGLPMTNPSAVADWMRSVLIPLANVDKESRNV